MAKIKNKPTVQISARQKKIIESMTSKMLMELTNKIKTELEETQKSLTPLDIESIIRNTKLQNEKIQNEIQQLRMDLATNSNNIDMLKKKQTKLSIS